MNTQLQAPCDRELGRGAKARPARHPRWTIAATMMASSLSFIDGSVTNVALPAIGQDLAADAGSLPWVINAYLLPLSALLLIGGAAGDHFGRRRMLVAGIALFAIASVGCAMAPNLNVLLAFRGLQGVGAAILLPNSLGILGSSFEGEARGRAVGTWAAAGAVASAIGPPLGGWLVETVGWPAIFYLNLPVAAAAALIAMLFVDESVEDGRKLDWRGAALATAALGLLTWGLTLWSSTHSATRASLAGVGAGALLFLAFLRTEQRLGERAMMPLSLFASRPLVGLTVLTLLLYGALGGLLLLLPYLLIVGGGYTPIQAGLALLPFSLVLGVASRLTGRFAERIGPRWPLTIGPIVTGIGFALFVRTDPAASYWSGVLPAVAVISAGMALAVAPLTTTVLASVDEKHTGTASGFNSAVARTGGLIATALSGAVLSMTGAGLIEAFHAAAIVASALAVASGLVAFATLGERKA